MNYQKLRSRLVQATALTALASTLAISGAIAQEDAVTAVAAESSSEDESRQDVVVITGSRIARSDLLAASPVTTIDAESIEIAGATNVQDFLNELPATGVPALTDTNSNFTLNGGGVNLVNLRNLGSNRTLVLVNGRRHVGGVAGSPAVDVNMIPSALIDRVDVVTGGASRCIWLRGGRRRHKHHLQERF